MKNCNRGLKNATRGRSPRAAFSSSRSQFFTIRTDPEPANNFFFFSCDKLTNHKNYNFLACDWFKNVLFSTNSLAKLLSDSLLLDSLLLDSLLSDSLISQSHSKL